MSVYNHKVGFLRKGLGCSTEQPGCVQSSDLTRPGLEDNNLQQYLDCHELLSFSCYENIVYYTSFILTNQAFVLRKFYQNFIFMPTMKYI